MAILITYKTEILEDQFPRGVQIRVDHSQGCWVAVTSLDQIILRHGEFPSGARSVSAKDEALHGFNFREGEYQVGQTRLYIKTYPTGSSNVSVVAPSIRTFVRVWRMLTNNAIGEHHRVLTGVPAEMTSSPIE